jgi:hypothetical protein
MVGIVVSKNGLFALLVIIAPPAIIGYVIGTAV